MNNSKSNTSLMVLIILLILGLSSCDFSFVDQGDLTVDPDSITELVELFDGGERRSYFNGDVLLYYDDYFFSGTTTQIQNHDAAGVLTHSSVVIKDASGLVVLEANYSALHVLESLSTFFNNNSLVVSSVFYIPAETGLVVDSSMRYVHGDGTNAPIGQLLASAQFSNSGGLLGGTWQEFYHGNPGPSMDKVFIKTTFGSQEQVATSVLPNKAVPRSLGSRSLTLPAPPQKVSLVVPADPAYAVPAMVSRSELEALGVVSWEYFQYDSHGASAITLDKDFYPIRGMRTDSRLEESITIDLTWGPLVSSIRQISSKKTYYGSTLALGIDVTYTSQGYPLSVKTQGAALLLPTEYTLEYASEGDFAGLPVRLDVSSNDNLLMYFTWDFSGVIDPIPTTLPDLISIDPLAYLEQVRASNLLINHFDGDGTKVESFKFEESTDPLGLRVTVLNGAGISNGYYILGYDNQNRSAFLSAYNEAGAKLWSQEYGYEQGLADAESFIASEFPELPEYGRLMETWVHDTVASWSNNFIMDMFL